MQGFCKKKHRKINERKVEHYCIKVKCCHLWVNLKEVMISVDGLTLPEMQAGKSGERVEAYRRPKKRHS